MVEGWQRLPIARTIAQNDRDVIHLHARCQTTSGASGSCSDGAQIEEDQIRTPYVHTNGAGVDVLLLWPAK